MLSASLTIGFILIFTGLIGLEIRYGEGHPIWANKSNGMDNFSLISLGCVLLGAVIFLISLRLLCL